MMKLIVHLFICAFFFYGCSVSPSINYYGRIEYPNDGAVFSKGQLVIFQAATNNADIEWLDKNGDSLSKSAKFSCVAEENLERIDLYVLGHLYDTISLTVSQQSSVIKRSIYGEAIELDVPAGVYEGYFISFGPETQRFSVTELSPNMKSFQHKAERSDAHYLRDMNVSVSQKMFDQRGLQPVAKIRGLSRSSTLSIPILEERQFYIVDIAGANNGQPYSRLFRNIRNSGSVSYWCDAVVWNLPESEFIIEQLDSIISSFSGLYYDRIIGLFGDHGDVDESECINVLFSNILNESGIAIGFFNPNDMFLNTGFNPASNEGETIYLGVPDESLFSFSSASIIATACHELCHLIHFYRQVYSDFASGNPEPEVPELFLDEGLAHLSESLAGVGVSGGNIGFFARYLENPWETSLSARNMYGLEDSIERRGAMAGFLSWLFWRAGGAVWHTDGRIEDKGGVCFLHNITAMEGNSWDIIGACLNADTDALLEEWANELIFSTTTLGYYDPITAEPLYLDPYMGTFSFQNGITISFNGVSKRNFSMEKFLLLPRSIIPISFQTDKHESRFLFSSIDGEAKTLLCLMSQTK